MNQERCQGEIEFGSLEKEKKFHMFSSASHINDPLPALTFSLWYMFDHNNYHDDIKEFDIFHAVIMPIFL